MKEKWRPIKGYTGYEISNKGNIRSWKHRHGKRKVPLKLSLLKGNKGYLRIALSQDGVQKMRRVHILVIETFGRPRPTDLHQVDHINEIKTDNRIENLQWVTGIENFRLYLKRRKNKTPAREESE